nr:molybdate ABC transporter substrate-binding protein [Caenimonas sp. SL110]
MSCAASVQVAVASNFALPMQKIAATFEADSGHKVVLSIGSTGRFYAQIRNGAPFDVLLAADDQTPLKLEAEGLGTRGGSFIYATGRLVLWSAKPNLVDDKGAILAGGGYNRLALADPRVAPYGWAAAQTLQKMNLSRLQASAVQAENIGQTYQFVQSGNADIGFVALSQVMQDGKIGQGSAWLVPAAMHSPIRQGAALLVKGKDNPAAVALVAYLRGDKARAIIRRHGYEL